MKKILAINVAVTAENIEWKVWQGLVMCKSMQKTQKLILQYLYLIC